MKYRKLAPVIAGCVTAYRIRGGDSSSGGVGGSGNYPCITAQHLRDAGVSDSDALASDPRGKRGRSARYDGPRASDP